jgi:hypothetical protein
MGTSGDDVLIGSKRWSMLVGDMGSDRFVPFPSAVTVIMDFKHEQGDKIDLSSLNIDFEQLRAHAKPVGDSTSLSNMRGLALTIWGVSPAELHREDFIVRSDVADGTVAPLVGLCLAAPTDPFL